MSSSLDVQDRIAGLVLGTALGDALGLPREGLTPGRAARLFGSPPLKHRFVFRQGMVSDDTEHMVMTACALLSHHVDVDSFVRDLARRMRWWLLRLPAGVGLATARSIIRMWLGWSPKFCGVRSAGNGPAMRAGILGACLPGDEELLRTYVRASTRLTHTDSRAEIGAWLIALAARAPFTGIDDESLFERYLVEANDQDWLIPLKQLQESVTRAESATQFAQRIGMNRGVSGYIIQTVLAVLFCRHRWPRDYRRAMEEVIAMGGDTDSTAAILGGLMGATCGVESIPREWLQGVREWPCSMRWMREQLVPALCSIAKEPHDARTRTTPIWWPAAQVIRNLLFLMIVLTHGFRRLLPPY